MVTLNDLDERVTLQSRSVVKDAFGQEVITWVDAATVWAHVAPIRGREFFAAAAIQQEHTIKVTLRWRDVALTQRLIWRGKNHDIVAAVMVGRRQWVEIMALQGVKDGR